MKRFQIQLNFAGGRRAVAPTIYAFAEAESIEHVESACLALLKHRMPSPLTSFKVTEVLNMDSLP